MQTPSSAPLRSRIIEKSPIHYGWVILVVSTISMIMTGPGQTYAVSIFIERFIEDLGLSRSAVSSLYTIGTVTASLAMPFVGRQIDKRGPRIMVMVIALLFGSVVMYMSTVRTAFMLVLGFVGIRMLGQGSLSLVSRYTANQWWVRRRGLVLGIAGVFGSILGTGLIPRLINWLIEQYGWRTSYAILGAAVILITVPLGYIFFRRNPEQYGLEPDAGLPPPPIVAGKSEPIEENWETQDVIRTRAFWLVSLGVASFDMLGTGVMFHMISIMGDSGISAGAAAGMFLWVSMATAVTTLLTGVLIDRIAAKYILSFGLFMQVGLLLLGTSLFSMSIAVLYAVLIGVVNGCGNTISSVLYANYFGRKNLGNITGVTMTIGVAASGLGPLVYGVGRDLAESYTLPLILSAIFPLVFAVLALTLKRPKMPG